MKKILRPGINGKPFKIKLNEDFYNKGDLIRTITYHGIVTKVYSRTWYRRLLKWMGFKTKWFTIKIQAITYKTDNYVAGIDPYNKCN